MVKNPLANTGDTGVLGSIPGLGTSPGVGTGNPLHYSRLENTTDREAWWAAVHGATRVRHDRATERTHGHQRGVDVTHTFHELI